MENLQNLNEALIEAAKLVPPSWPLTSFIAYHPLWELHQQDFVTVLIDLHQRFGVQGLLPLNNYNNLIKLTNKSILMACEELGISSPNDIDSFAEQYTHKLNDNTHHQEMGFDESRIRQACLSFLLPYLAGTTSGFHKTASLWQAWRETMGASSSTWRTFIANWPAEEAACLAALAAHVGITQFSLAEQVRYFQEIFWHCLGVASLMKWQSGTANLVTLCTIWLMIGVYFSQDEKTKKIKHSKKSKKSKKSNIEKSWFSRYVLHVAQEIQYEADLLSRLNSSVQFPVNQRAQWVFCIDTRSEGVRRHLEAIPGHETFGFAGFFGFVFRLKTPGCRDHIQCPALFAPTVNLTAHELPGAFKRWLFTHLALAFHEAKSRPLAAFGFVELYGLWYGLASAWRALFPYSFSRRLRQESPRALGLDLPELSSKEIQESYSLDEKIQGASLLLNAMGLVDNFAPVVVLVGHGSKSENNPYASSLDCGACGGNAGLLNAEVAAQILNEIPVREALALKGIDIPSHTRFVAGLHQTTEDLFYFSDHDQVSSHLHDLVNDMEQALSALRAERRQSLPGNFSLQNRAYAWSELIPEMALVNNAAFIIAPRALTAGKDLERRCFLHSYDWRHDENGESLVAIMNGPMIVAHWISGQYYFSTTDPQYYGSGNKMLHNVIPGLGVIEGNCSDLKIGLPWQSVAFGEERVHQPLRLLVVIYAPKARVEKILAENPPLSALFNGRWARLRIIDPNDVLK